MVQVLMLYTLLIVAIFDYVYFAIDTILHRRSTNLTTTTEMQVCLSQQFVSPLIKSPLLWKGRLNLKTTLHPRSKVGWI